MDPFREEHEAIYMTSLDDLDTEERQALRHALSPLLHVLSKKSLTGWYKNCVLVGGGGGGGGVGGDGGGVYARVYVMYMILEEAIYEKYKNANTRNEWNDSLRYQMPNELAQMFCQIYK